MRIIRMFQRMLHRSGALLIAGLLIPQHLCANPAVPQVVNGQASFSAQGTTLTVTNSDRAIINWRSFSIGPNELTRFIQPTTASSVLNRVIGNNPSAIYGAMQSNGRVYLVNQNGIFIGPKAAIDVNGLVASTLNIANDDFRAGRLNFTAGPLAGKIENQGSIRTPSGGSIYLIAPDVTNSGIITAPNGDILLAAGHSVSLVESATPEIAVVVSAPESQALNLGSVIAGAGRIGIYGGVIAQKGVISADSAVAEGGKIFLRATRGVTLDAGSMTSANGAKGGEIAIQTAEGSALVSGSVEARGTLESGGSVRLLGERVGLLDRGSVDVSGATGGGTALIGGDYQGKNPEIRNAQAAYVGAEAVIKADARDSGDGGRVIVWSDEATRAYGTISARGGTNGGNGGLVETSGKTIDFSGVRVDASARKGRSGLWLIDPNELTIDAPGATALTAALDTGTSGTDVTVTEDSSSYGTVSAGTGNILVNAPVSWVKGSKLTLQASGGISIDAAITGTNGSLDLIASNGGISQTAAITANTLHAEAATGIALNSPTNSVASFSATNGTSGDISLVNTAATLQLNGNISNTGTGGVSITNNGALNAVGWTQTTGGNISLTANSGTASIGNNLIAGANGLVTITATGSSSDILLNNSNVYSGSDGGGSGNIELHAGRNIALNPATIKTAGYVGLFSDGTITQGGGNIQATTLTAQGSGDILLSQTNVVNVFSATNNGTSGGITFTNAPSLSITGITQSGGGNIEITATDTNSDILVSGDGIQKTNSTSDAALTLKAGRAITVNGPISASAGKLDVTLNSHYLNDTTPGSVFINSTVTTNGGNLVVGGGTNPAALPAIGYDPSSIDNDKLYGVFVTNGGINTGGGNITIRGQGVANSDYNANGVHLEAPLNAGGGDILLAGTAGAYPANSSAGVDIRTTVETSVSGKITIDGTGGANNLVGKINRGVYINTASALVQTENGDITITGQGGVNTDTPSNPNNTGVHLAIGSIQSTNGAISITGTPGSTGSKGIVTTGASSITTQNAITLISDKLSLSPTSGDIGGESATVNIHPATIGRAVVLGADSGDAGDNLEISAAELGKIKAQALNIDTTTGSITVNAPIAPSTVTALNLASRGSITQTTGSSITIPTLNASAHSGIGLDQAANNATTVTLANSGSGNINYKNSLPQASDTLDIKANNMADGGNIAIEETVGNLKLSGGDSTTTSPGTAWLSLTAAGDITQDIGSRIGSQKLVATGKSVTLAADNYTGVIAGKSTNGDFVYKSVNEIQVTTVNTTNGVSATNGGITLDSGMGIRQDNDAPLVSGSAGLMLSSSGQVSLLSSSNVIPKLAVTGTVPGSFTFTDNSNLVVNGITATGGSITLNTTAGHTLTVSGAINSGTSPGSNVLLSADTGINVNADVTGNGVMLWTPGTANIAVGAKVEGSSGLELSATSLVLDGMLKSGGNMNIYPTTPGRGIFIGASAPSTGPCSAGGCLIIPDVSLSKIDTQHLFIGSDMSGDPLRPDTISGDIYIGGAVNRTATGFLALLTGGGVYQQSGAPITAQNLGVRATGGPIELIDPTNHVTNIAATTSGNFSFKNSGDLNIASLTGGNPPETVTGIHAANASLESTGGGIFDAVSSAPAIVASSVSLAASTGIGSGFGEQGTPLKTQVSTLSATNTGTSGDINILNTGPLTTSDWISNGNPYNTSGGRVTIRAKSPLTIGGSGGTGGISAMNEVWLEAGASGTGVTTDNLTINGDVYSDTNKTVTLRAGNSIIENGTIQGNVKRYPNLNPAPPPPPPPPPTVDQCVQNPALSGCSSVLPSLNTCTAAPTTPGCSAVLPSLNTCTTAPSTPGCSAVLPSLNTCTTAPATPGCSAVLPAIATCTTAPATPGCSAVLPTITTCTSAPATPGCSAVLPTLATCTSAPATPGCSAVLPPLATCTSAPSTPGCSAVLPTLATCTSAPATPGCSAVLPSLATCTAAPATPGCSAVLPATCAAGQVLIAGICQPITIIPTPDNPSTVIFIPVHEAANLPLQNVVQSVLNTVAPNLTEGSLPAGAQRLTPPSVAGSGQSGTENGSGGDTRDGDARNRNGNTRSQSGGTSDEHRPQRQYCN